MDTKKFIKNTAILAGSSVGIMYLVNQAVNYIATSTNFRQKDKTNDYQWKFGNIRYTVAGEGKPLLLIHDLDVASSSYEWNKVIALLSNTHKVYSIDLMGCGNSDKDQLTYTNYMYITLINDFIKEVIKEEADIIATGNSAAIAIMSTLVCDKIGEIILVNPYDYTVRTDMSARSMKYTHKILSCPILGTFMYNIFNSKKTIGERFDNEYYYNSGNSYYEERAVYFESLHKGNSRGKYLFASIRAHYTDVDITNALKNCPCNISIISGGENSIYSDIAEKYVENNEDICTYEIYNTAYLPQLENPQEFVHTVNTIL